MRDFLCFQVLRYYYRGVPSWCWFFPFHYSPTATDLASTLAPRPGKPTGSYAAEEFPFAAPLDPISQLMGVFPAASSHSLPAVCQKLMSSANSPIIDFYPTEFTLDPNGARMKWQWIALLPFIDEARLTETITSRVLPKLKKPERQRNARGAALVFAHRSTALGTLLQSVDRPTDAHPQLPGEVSRHRPKGAAKFEVADEVVVGGYVECNLHAERVVGVQPGAVAPPPVLKGGRPRGPRPRMMLVDLQAANSNGGAGRGRGRGGRGGDGRGCGGDGRGRGGRGGDRGRGRGDRGRGRSRGGGSRRARLSRLW